MTDVADRYRELAAEFTRRIEAVPDELWGRPSPCAGWDVRDVLEHVIETHRRTPTYVGASLESNTPVGRDPRGAWAEARDAMQDLLTDPERASLEHEGYFGRTTLRDTVDGFVCFDLLVHGWDIARATGQDETLPAHEVDRVYSDAVRLGDGLRADGVCGPAVGVSEDASAQDRLLGYLGRTP